jgi:chorismate mutase/prephenate dehydrogenase
MDLPALRELLDSIDDELIGKIYMRLRLSGLVGLIKSTRRLPIEDLDRERNVLMRWSRRARLLGLVNEALLDQLSTILSYSKLEQVRRIGDRRVVVYGYGSMGRVLLRLLSRAGYDVVLCGRDMGKVTGVAEEFGVAWSTPHEAIPQSDIVVFATPPGATVRLVSEYRGLLRLGSLVMDVSSVKSRVVGELLQRLPGHVEYVSIHPLFGDLVNPVGEYVGVIEVRCTRWCGWVQEMLRGIGLSVVVFNDPEEHDRYMALHQVLHHMVLRLLDEAMPRLARELNIDPRVPMVTHSMRYTLKALERFRGSRDVVEEIMVSNPYGETVIRVLREIIGEVAGSGSTVKP